MGKATRRTRGLIFVVALLALVLSTASPAAARPLKKGSKGPRVAFVQRALGLHADRIFGSQTKRAVKRFQRRHGLTADGIVGPATWSALKRSRGRSSRVGRGTVRLLQRALGIAAEEEGDRLSDVELVNLVLNVLVGGVDTTQSQLAHALRLFSDHPEQWALLAEQPELAPRAVDEVLRFEPITPFTARIAMEDVTYRDVLFPEGTVVLVCAFTGNRDGEPDGFDITAERRGKPLTFGAGIHYCLGANLARAELQEALNFLAPRTQGLALDGEPEYGTIDGIYGLDALPIRWG